MATPVPSRRSHVPAIRAGCPSHGVLTVLTGRNIHKQSPQVTSVPSHRTPQDKYSDTRTVLQAPVQVGKVQVLNTHHTNTNAMQRLRGKTGALTDGNCRIAARTLTDGNCRMQPERFGPSPMGHQSGGIRLAGNIQLV